MAQAKSEPAPSNSNSEFSTNGALIREVGGSSSEIEKLRNTGEDEEEEEEVELAEEVDEDIGMIGEDISGEDPNFINGIPAAIGPHEEVKELEKQDIETEKDGDKVRALAEVEEREHLEQEKPSTSDTPEKDTRDPTGLLTSEPEPSSQSEPAVQVVSTEKPELTPEKTENVLCEQEMGVILEQQQPQEVLPEKETEETLMQQVVEEKPKPPADEKREEEEKEENKMADVPESLNEASTMCTDTKFIEKNEEKVLEEEQVKSAVVEHKEEMQDTVQDEGLKGPQEQSTAAIVEELAAGELAAVQQEEETQPIGLTSDEAQSQVDVVQAVETEVILPSEEGTTTGPESEGPSGQNDECEPEQVAATTESENDEPDIMVETAERFQAERVEEKEEVVKESQEADGTVPPQHTETKEPEVPETTPVSLPAPDVQEPVVPDTDTDTAPALIEQLETPDAQEPEAPITTTPPPVPSFSPEPEKTSIETPEVQELEAPIATTPLPVSSFSPEPEKTNIETSDAQEPLVPDTTTPQSDSPSPPGAEAFPQETDIEQPEVKAESDETDNTGLYLLEEAVEVEEMEQEDVVQMNENELVETVEAEGTEQTTKEEPAVREEVGEDDVKLTEDKPIQSSEKEETIESVEEVPVQMAEGKESARTSTEEQVKEEKVCTDISEQQTPATTTTTTTEEDKAGDLAEWAGRDAVEPKQVRPVDLPALLEGRQQVVEEPKEVTRDEPAPAERKAGAEAGGTTKETERPITVGTDKQASTQGGAGRKEEPAQATDKQPTTVPEDEGRKKIEELKKAILKARDESRRRSKVIEIPQEDTVPSWVRARRKSEEPEHAGISGEGSVATTTPDTAEVETASPTPATPPATPTSVPPSATTAPVAASSTTSAVSTTSIPFRDKQVRFENGLPGPEIAVLTIRRPTQKRKEASQNLAEKEKEKEKDKKEAEIQKEAPKKAVSMESPVPQEDEQYSSSDSQDYEISLYVKVSIAIMGYSLTLSLCSHSICVCVYTSKLFLQIKI